MFKKLPKRSRKRAVRYGLLVANLLVLVAIATFVVQTNANTPSKFSATPVLGEETPVTNPLDQLSSADIAVQIAFTANLEERAAVVNKADTVNAQLTVSSEDQKVVSKPQVVSEGLKSRRDIQTYTVVDGDSVPSVAAKFGVTSDTIRWSNNLTGDALTPGQTLLISPVNGIVYKVQSGDTPDSIATRYKSNKELLIAMNDAEISGLPVGEYIIIPDGQPPVTGRVGSLASAASSGGFSWGGNMPIYGANGYDYGYCTWYAANRRAQIGRPIPSNLGNASTWRVLAQRAGFGVGNVPAAGAVIWTPPRDYYGHVGFVESVNPDGSVNVSEMNVRGWGVVSHKTLSPAEAANYSYIY